MWSTRRTYPRTQENSHVGKEKLATEFTENTEKGLLSGLCFSVHSVGSLCTLWLFLSESGEGNFG